MIDQPPAPKPGQGPDPDRLAEYLAREPDCPAGPPIITRFPSGYSNLTYLLTWPDRELILRLPPPGTKAATAHDMAREFKVLSALAGTFPCPRPILHCPDPEIIGAEFFIMERLTGIIIRRDPPTGLDLVPEQAAQLFDNLTGVQARLHQLDYRAAGLAELGKPEGYLDRQIEGWSKRYRKARTPDVPDFEPVMAWLAENKPEAGIPPGLIHNDFKLDNVVLDPTDPTRIVGVLDWEMATLGDPLLDLGSSLAYWVQADDPAPLKAVKTLATDLDGAPTRREVVARYGELTGLEVAGFDFYYCFGLFRLAGIAQQIYYRFYHGQAKDPRFGALGRAVAVLEQTALAVIEHGRW